MTPILCPQCDHDIDAHDAGLSQRCYPEGVSYCWCRLAPSDIARAIMIAEPTDAEVAAAMQAWFESTPEGFSGGIVSNRVRERTWPRIRAALKAAAEARR